VYRCKHVDTAQLDPSCSNIIFPLITCVVPLPATILSPFIGYTSAGVPQHQKSRTAKVAKPKSKTPPLNSYSVQNVQNPKLHHFNYELPIQCYGSTHNSSITTTSHSLGTTDQLLIMSITSLGKG